MRLKKEHIERIAGLILNGLKKKNLIKPRVGEQKILEKINAVITEDLSAEARLEEEARKLMDKYRPQIQSGELDERRAFLMIKKQLAKERKMVI